MQPENLTPEQRKAIKVLQDCLPQWQQYLCYDITDRDICHTDFKGFTLQKISYSDLQHGTNWTWNQSNSKKKVQLENDVSVVIQKFNTRKKRKNIPSGGVIFKMWMFTVYKQTENSFLGVFVWCEKGLPPLNKTQQQSYLISECFPTQNTAERFPPQKKLESNASANSQSLFTSQEFANCKRSDVDIWESFLNSEEILITLEDLQFLSPFVDATTASSLGW